SPTVQASSGSSPSYNWSFSPMLGVGYETKGENDIIGHGSLGISYRFSIPLSLRLAIGAVYLRTPDHADLHEHVSLSLLYHFYEKGQFNPYLLFGADAMISAIDGNLHIGLGNTFPITERISLFVEGAFGTNVMFYWQGNRANDRRYHGRFTTGVSFHF
ncbi:hypothetical protein KJ708_12790, partial [bacterium]|nr:hypothetical protein [bacterium]